MSKRSISNQLSKQIDHDSVLNAKSGDLYHTNYDEEILESREGLRDDPESLASLPVKKRKIEVNKNDNSYDDEDDDDSDSENDHQRIMTYEANFHEHEGRSRDLTQQHQPRASDFPHLQNMQRSNAAAKPQYRSPIPRIPDPLKSSVYETRWERMFHLLVQCDAALGTCKIPLSYEIADTDGTVIKLGLWLGTQRQLYRKGQLRKDKLDRLQTLVDAGKMDWGEVKTSSDEIRWNAMYDKLVKYCEANGHCNVPERYLYIAENGEQVKLGRWLDRQRGHMKKKKIRADRMMKLQHLIDQGILFRDALEEDDHKWQRCYEALCAYGQEHGNCNVPHSFVVTLPNTSVVKLGTWLSTQRHLQKRVGKLRHDRFIKLQDLVDKGLLKWGDVHLGKDEKWELCYAALMQYEIEHGNMDVSRLHESILADGTKVRLRRWLNRQVMAYHEGKLKADRQARLQDLVNQGKIMWEVQPENQWFEMAGNAHHHDGRSPMMSNHDVHHHTCAHSSSSMQHLPMMHHAVIHASSGDHVLHTHNSLQLHDHNDTSDSDIEELDEDQVDALMHVASGN